MPILMAHGTMDPVIPMSKGLMTRQTLTRLGYSIRWHDYPMQHEVCMDEIKDIRAWLLEVFADPASAEHTPWS